MLGDYEEAFAGYEYTGYYIKNGGFYHRISGPARVWHDDHPEHPGHKEWYLFGERINVSSQQEFEKYLKMKAFW